MDRPRLGARPRGRWRRAGVVGAVVALAAGCQFLPGGGDTPADKEPGPRRTQSSDSPTTPPAMTPRDYQAALEQALTPVEEALATVTRADELPGLTKRVRTAGSSARAAAEELAPLDPPEAVVAAHDDLVTALHALGADLDAMGAEVEARHLCAPSSALARLGQADGLTAVPALLASLADHGVEADLVVPATPPERHRRLPNGTVVEPASGSGGSLRVSNGTDTDAALTLADGERPVVTVYVRDGGEATVDGVPHGTYTPYFTTGADWDPSTRSFTRACTFQRFDEPLTYQEGYDTTGQLTLHPVAGGNASTSDVPPDRFPR